MRRIALAAALISSLAAAAACAPAAPPAPDTAAMIAAATALNDQFLAAYNAGDGAALAALYADSPETVSMPPDAMMRRGIAAIREGYAPTAPVPGMTLELTDVHHVALTDAVLSAGLWKLTMPGPGGEPMVVEGRFTDVKVERNGKWVYLMDHASTPMPPPPGSPGS